MPGILYVVATPIGNLEDVTLRALRVLREVALVAAEDTRRTARLLQKYSIPTPTTSLHAHNERQKTPALLERLSQGASIALVTDAGTPVLSDPGGLLVRAAREAGIRVEPVPGPSAVAAALSAAGVESDGFLFVGFPPSRARERRVWLADLARPARAVVMFEAPHRIIGLLTDICEVLGPDIVVTLARELTKRHEELVTRPIMRHLEAPPATKGEFTLIIHPTDPSRLTAKEALTPAQVGAEYGYMTNIQGLSRRAALRALAIRHAVPAREIYRLLEETRG